MLTYELIDVTFSDVNGYYSAEALKPQYGDNQKQKFSRIAKIAQLFKNGVKKKEGSITNGKTPVDLSLDGLAEELKKPKNTLMRDLHTFKASFDRHLEIRTGPYGIPIIFELKDYRLKGHQPIK